MGIKMTHPALWGVCNKAEGNHEQPLGTEGSGKEMKVVMPMVKCKWPVA
jgi:hypothetical protein